MNSAFHTPLPIAVSVRKRGSGMPRDPGGDGDDAADQRHAPAEQHHLAAVLLEELLTAVEVLLAGEDEPPLAGQRVQPVVAEPGAQAVEHAARRAPTRVAAGQVSQMFSAPVRARNPASGRITSDGMGGIRFSRRISRPTPAAPSESTIENTQFATCPGCPIVHDRNRTMITLIACPEQDPARGAQDRRDPEPRAVASASSSARATKPATPPGKPSTYCTTPPVQAGKPMPKIEPMFASATLVSTPSSRQRCVSTRLDRTASARQLGAGRRRGSSRRARSAARATARLRRRPRSRRTRRRRCGPCGRTRRRAGRARPPPGAGSRRRAGRGARLVPDLARQRQVSSSISCSTGAG